MEREDEFETHITVRPADTAEVERLRAWAAESGLKFTHIILAQGRTPSQPMLTFHNRAPLGRQWAVATTVADAVHHCNRFPATRIKVEMAATSPTVPQSNDEGEAQPPERYFEHHVKLLLDDEADMPQLIRVALCHTAHVSRNALRTRDDGRHERFVTQRCFGVGRASAHAALVALVEALEGTYEIMDVEEEFVMFDSDLTLDAGWIE